MKCQVILLLAFLAVTAFSQPRNLNAHLATNETNNNTGLTSGSPFFSSSGEVFIFGLLTMLFSKNMRDAIELQIR